MAEVVGVDVDAGCVSYRLVGREELVTTLTHLAADPEIPPIVLVTHHVEEIPEGFTHALLLRDGQVHARGPLGEVLTAANLSSCFGLAVGLEQRRGRWAAWAT